MHAEAANRVGTSTIEEIVLAVVGEILGSRPGREDDEHPAGPGPWDRVIREAFKLVHVYGPSPDPWRFHGPETQPWRIMPTLFGPHPDPWGPRPIPWPTMEARFGPLPDPCKHIVASIAERFPAVWDILGGSPRWGDEVALNPQPLPPRQAFLGALADTVLSRALLLQDVARTTQSDGPNDATAAPGRYIGQFVDDICGNDFRFRWPFPGPRPNWFVEAIGVMNQLHLASWFAQATQDTVDTRLHHTLQRAARRLTEVGVARLGGNHS
jgi:hypothetical protein